MGSDEEGEVMKEQEENAGNDVLVGVMNLETGDALLSYSIPADRYLDFLKAIDDAAQSIGAQLREETTSSHVDLSSSHQNRRVIDLSHAHYYSSRETLSDVDLKILEYLWAREGKPLFKKDIADDLGYTLAKVEYSIRKKLKHQGLITVVRHTDERHANGANSYFVDKDFVLEKISKMVKGLTLDLSEFDIDCPDDVARLFCAAEDLFVSRHVLKEGEMTLSDYLAGDLGLRGQISVKEAVLSIRGTTPHRASSLLDDLGIDSSMPLNRLDQSDLASILGFEGEVAS